MLPDFRKPEDVKEETWRKHLEWMKVMESSRQSSTSLKDLMDEYFVAPSRGDKRSDQD
jgi:hypothetical protein